MARIRPTCAEACGQCATVDNRCVIRLICYGVCGGVRDRGHLTCETVEGHRYAEDEPSWYPGQGQYARSANPYDTGTHERPSGAFRLPEQRPAVAPPSNSFAATDPLAATGSHSRSVRGPEYPTIRPPDEPEQTRSAKKKSSRPFSSTLVSLITIVLFIPILRLLIDQAFADHPTPAGTIPAVLLTLGFALTAIGLFALAKAEPKAEAKAGTKSRETWLRLPVAYLPVGLILLLAAGLAVA